MKKPYGPSILLREHAGRCPTAKHVTHRCLVAAGYPPGAAAQTKKLNLDSPLVFCERTMGVVGRAIEQTVERGRFGDPQLDHPSLAKGIFRQDAQIVGQ